ncbi:MAG: DUF2243 domain-containing protein [Caldilinea sp. CFX5]|nr:DUF2243 domain-containing protein [Caldilinea sp. CFX5]
MNRDENRTDALVNGALIALGVLGIVDNVVAHWLLGLHRAAPGPNATPVEVILVVLSAGLLILGVWREAQARRRESGE